MIPVTSHYSVYDVMFSSQILLVINGAPLWTDALSRDKHGHKSVAEVYHVITWWLLHYYHMMQQ